MMLNLPELSQGGQQACEIALRDSSPLQVESIVRRVPNKRLVCRGVWNSRPVYAKIFIGDDAEKYALRDKRGVEWLIKAEITTPALLSACTAKDGEAVVLIFQAIEKCENAEVWYASQLSQALRFDMAKKIVSEVAKLHTANLLQTDLYLKNFLITNESVYTLDGDGIRKYDKISKRQALQNLSVLLSKFDVLEIENWQSSLVRIYAEVRCWKTLPDLIVIKNLVNLHRIKVASQYADKKVFRQCTDVKVYQQDNYFLAISNYFSFKSLPKTSQDCDALIASQQPIKSGNTCTVALVKIDTIRVVIKRYNIKSLGHHVSRALRRTRAATSWANAHRLKLLGIATATPVELIEQRYFGLRGKAYFLSEYIDAPDVAEFFLRTNDEKLRAETVINIANLFYRLYILQISHGDMKASNIKIVNVAPLLIDLDSMQQHQFTWAALNAHVRDLQRFMRNWKESPALYNGFVETFKEVYVDHQPLRLAHIVK